MAKRQQNPEGSPTREVELHLGSVMRSDYDKVIWHQSHQLELKLEISAWTLAGLHFYDVFQGSRVTPRTIFMQQKTRRWAQFEIAEQQCALPNLINSALGGNSLSIISVREEFVSGYNRRRTINQKH
jgi:hypothetical protein